MVTSINVTSNQNPNWVLNRNLRVANFHPHILSMHLSSSTPSSSWSHVVCGAATNAHFDKLHERHAYSVVVHTYVLSSRSAYCLVAGRKDEFVVVSCLAPFEYCRVDIVSIFSVVATTKEQQENEQDQQQQCRMLPKTTTTTIISFTWDANRREQQFLLTGQTNSSLLLNDFIGLKIDLSTNHGTVLDRICVHSHNRQTRIRTHRPAF